MKKIIIAAFMLAMSSQTVEAKCVNKVRMSRIAARVLADTFDCKSSGEISEYFNRTRVVSGICNMPWPMSKLTEKEACRAIGGYAGILTANQIPTAWNCNFIPHYSAAEGIMKEVENGCLDEL